MTIGITEALAGAGALTGIASLGWNLRQRCLLRRASRRFQEELERGLGRLEGIGAMEERFSAKLAAALEESKRDSQASLESLGGGRLSAPARARALRLLRSGMSPESTAAEVGMARSEALLLRKVAAALAPRAQAEG